MLSLLRQILSFKVVLHNIHFINSAAVFGEYITLTKRKFQQRSPFNWWVITPQRLPKLPLKLMANFIFLKCEMVKFLYTLNMVSNVKMNMFQIEIFEEINLFQYKSLCFFSPGELLEGNPVSRVSWKTKIYCEKLKPMLLDNIWMDPFSVFSLHFDVSTTFVGN